MRVVHGFEKLGAACGDGDVAEPAVFLRAVPVLHAFVRYHHVARFQAAGGATVFLIPAFAACNEQDLVAVGVNVPVVAAGGFKADVGNGCRCVGRGSQARQITLSDKDIGVPFVFFAKRKMPCLTCCSLFWVFIFMLLVCRTLLLPN